ncbi:Putative ribonuclease H protein At1g65750 [Linum perenne]
MSSPVKPSDRPPELHFAPPSSSVPQSGDGQGVNFRTDSSVNPSGRSYRSALQGQYSSPSSVQQWIPVGEKDIVPLVRNGIKSLNLSKDFKDKLCKPWSNTVIVRLLGKNIGYSYLCHRLHAIWKPLGDLHIVDLDRNCFLVKFAQEQDYFKALTGGPWMLLDHYLIVHQWDQSFRVSDDLPKKMVVWVRFPYLPIHFYHPQVLTSLGNLIGKTIKIDFNTQRAERGKFARIAIEIDLSEPLASVVELDGALQKVEYENMPFLCFDCGKVGHESGNCPMLIKDSDETMATKGEKVAEGLTGLSPEPEPAPGTYGPWMLVERKSRRPRKEGALTKEKANDGKEDLSSIQKKKAIGRVGAFKGILSREEKGRLKSQGGLGLRKTRDLNLAYLMKLGWAIVMDPSRIWVRVMTTKYLKEIDADSVLRRKSGGSSLWRGIRSVWHTMVEASQQSIGNGLAASWDPRKRLQPLFRFGHLAPLENKVVFEHKLATSDQLRLRVLHWIAGVRETMRAESRVLFKQAHDREEVLVQWEPAPEDFITINTDGSVLQPNRHASAGGILRDSQGQKIAAFAANLGSCSIMRAELRVAEIGLKIAWELGYRKAHLQMDSKTAVNTILSKGDEDSRHFQTVRSIHEWLDKY